MEDRQGLAVFHSPFSDMWGSHVSYAGSHPTFTTQVKGGQYPRISFLTLEEVPTRRQAQNTICAPVGTSSNLVSDCGGKVGKGRDGKLTWKPGKSSRRDFGSFSR